jgi:hypothetical protein
MSNLYENMLDCLKSELQHVELDPYEINITVNGRSIDYISHMVNLDRDGDLKVSIQLDEESLIKVVETLGYKIGE